MTMGRAKARLTYKWLNNGVVISNPYDMNGEPVVNFKPDNLDTYLVVRVSDITLVQ